MRTAGVAAHEMRARKPLLKIATLPANPVHPWAIVLAGGAGIRLRPLARAICGDERPKQYVPLVGPRSLLRQTLDRIAVAIPAERTVTVVTQAHARYIAEEFGRAPTLQPLVQPSDRGTAVAILLAAQWVSWQDPDGILVVFPSDHLILGELTFMTHVLDVARFVDSHPDRLVLFGAPPTEPEVEYGWIEPGMPLGRIHGTPVSSVKRFWEKPSARHARACLAKGYLWNTFIMAAKAATLLDVGRQMVPELSERLSRIKPAIDSQLEPWAIDEAYASLERTNFSRDVLERCTSALAVSRLPADVRWLDLGSPERVVKGLVESGLAPPWLTILKPRPAIPTLTSA